MSDRLVDVSTPEALAELRSSGARVVFEFGDVAVVRETEGVDLPPSRIIREDSDDMSRRSATNLTLAAYQLRQTPAWKAKRAERPLYGADIGDIIDGKVG